MSSIVGIVYFIQPVELIGTQRYKIGCSKKQDLSRLTHGYNNGTRYIIVSECLDPHKTEEKIKEVFKKKFTLIGGREYFKGDELEMKMAFRDIMYDNDIKYGHLIVNESNHIFSDPPTLPFDIIKEAVLSRYEVTTNKSDRVKSSTIRKQLLDEASLKVKSRVLIYILQDAGAEYVESKYYYNYLREIE